MKKAVSFITVGHSPREDIMDELEAHLSSAIEVRQRGALDHMSVEEVKSRLVPSPGEAVMTSRIRGGEMMDFSKKKVMPLLQKAIDEECEKGASMIAILCTNAFDALHCRVPMLLPFDILHSITAAIQADCKVGALFPFESFAGIMEKNWLDYGVSVVYQCMGTKEKNWDRYAEFFRQKKTDLLILDCIGYTYACRDYFAKQLSIPIVHPRTILVETIHSLLGVS